MEKKNWSGLLPELLAPIAESLGLIELLSFRSVCKDWNSASATASAQIESSKEPWFLVYGETTTSECLLVSNSGKKHSINIPQLTGSVTCLASTQGWLLMSQNGGSMFFFCPFSHAKIDLPKFPHLEITEHVAAFSSAPTSQHCVVAVISRSKESEVEVNMIRRGADAWTNHKTFCPRIFLGAVKGAAFHDGAFSFFDDGDRLVTFSVESQSWGFLRIVYGSKEKSPDVENLQFFRTRKKFVSIGMDKLLGLSKDVSISTCGIQLPCDYIDEVVYCESIEGAEKSKSRHLKGVWIQPRFFKVSPNQTW